MNYNGEKCQLTTCGGMVSNSTMVCSGRGSCVGYNTCQCSAVGYYGSNCELKNGTVSNSTMVNSAFAHHIGGSFKLFLVVIGLLSTFLNM